MSTYFKKTAGALGLSLILLGLSAAPSLAAPAWSVSLASQPETLPRSDERVEFVATVTNSGDVATSGTVTAVVEIPTGNDTGLYKVSTPGLDNAPPPGWACSAQPTTLGVPGKATCTRSDPLAPGSSYPKFAVIAALRADAPEPSGTASLSVSGGGAAAPGSAQAGYTFTSGFSFGAIAGSFEASVGVEPGIPTETTITGLGPGTVELSSNSTVSGRQALFTGAQPFQAGEAISVENTFTGVFEPMGTIVAVSGGTITLSSSSQATNSGVQVKTSTVLGTATLTQGTNQLKNVATAVAHGDAVAGSNLLTNVTVSKGTLQVGQTVVDNVGDADTKAGRHPYVASTTFGFNTYHGLPDQGGLLPIEHIKDTVIDAPRGFVGNALASPELCPAVEDVILGLCPPRSAVGKVEIYTAISAPQQTSYKHSLPFKTAIFSVEPEFGEPAQFAFAITTGHVPYTFVPELRADEGYAVSFRTAPIIIIPPLYGASVTLCDFGARFTPSPGNAAEAEFNSCKRPFDADANPQPLITNPTRCSGPPPTSDLKIDSWEHPQEVKTYSYSAAPVTACDAIDFEPESHLIPTNQEADAPTGLGVQIEVPIDGVLTNTGVSQANLDTATVTLPKGMSINPAAASGLEGCSLAQIKLHSNAKDECPEASKIGTVEIDTPLIRKTLTGSVFVARQHDNPFQAPIGLYMDFDSARDGVRIKVAGKLITDPVTGQLTSVFTENPEAPFSRLALKFNGGPRAALINPPTCGTYAIHSEFSPWSAVSPANPTPGEIVSQDSTYQVTSGPGGSPCPDNRLDPKLKAGLQGTQAGARSPFVFTLGRDDGTQRFAGIEVTTPKGLTAYLKGIPYCPDAALGSISEAEETGAAELASSACPSASQVGTSTAVAGAGLYPFQTPGKVYLAGPYKGAPVSLAVVTPAVAGPFDLGSVVIRNPLYVDPVTSQVTTRSDPIPTILHGVLLDVRDIRVALDRPNFTAAPTSCEPMAVEAKVTGESGAIANRSNRFQVGGCAALGFKPSLSIRLFGGTHRGSHPKLRAVLTPGPGDANIASASVALPHSEFLDQAHIKTICTRVQFAAKACPAGSIYGFAEATTPLLDSPVAGPVYLRSSDNPLPDLVASLRGPESQPIEVQVAGRIDSVHGGIRTTFETVPDQPVSSFILTMQGGKKGLLVNSRELCKSRGRAKAVFAAHNGRTASLRPPLANSCGKKGHGRKKAGKPHHGQR